jgi:phosphatidate phosphatase PAH1
MISDVNQIIASTKKTLDALELRKKQCLQDLQYCEAIVRESHTIQDRICFHQIENDVKQLQPQRQSPIQSRYQHQNLSKSLDILLALRALQRARSQIKEISSFRFQSKIEINPKRWDYLLQVVLPNVKNLHSQYSTLSRLSYPRLRLFKLKQGKSMVDIHHNHGTVRIHIPQITLELPLSFQWTLHQLTTCP